MTTDNRTSEPRRLKSCVAAWPECSTGEYNPSCCRFPKSCSATVYSEEHVTEDDLEPPAALEAAARAAQGAAPQAESEELAWYKRAAKHSADSMAEARATLQQLADRVDPFVFDELSSVLDDQPLDYETGWAIGEAAPVLPSSTVDEDAAIQLVQDLAREAYEAYEDSSDDAYGAWSWLTERHEQMRAGSVLAGKGKNDE